MPMRVHIKYKYNKFDDLTAICHIKYSYRYSQSNEIYNKRIIFYL